MNEVLVKIRHYRAVLPFLISFLAGCLCAGLFFAGYRSITARNLDQRYADQHDRAADIIGQLEAELNRERELNNQLREHNTRARELASELTDTTNRNVRNLQDAVGLISEIRTKLKVLEDFYINSDPGNSGN